MRQAIQVLVLLAGGYFGLKAAGIHVDFIPGLESPEKDANDWVDALVTAAQTGDRAAMLKLANQKAAIEKLPDSDPVKRAWFTVLTARQAEISAATLPPNPNPSTGSAAPPQVTTAPPVVVVGGGGAPVPPVTVTAPPAPGPAPDPGLESTRAAAASNPNNAWMVGGLRFSADQWNYYRQLATGVPTTVDLFPADDRGALMTVQEYYARRAAAGLAGLLTNRYRSSRQTSLIRRDGIRAPRAVLGAIRPGASPTPVLTVNPRTLDYSYRLPSFWRT